MATIATVQPTAMAVTEPVDEVGAGVLVLRLSTGAVLLLLLLDDVAVVPVARSVDCQLIWTIGAKALRLLIVVTVATVV